ncbi:ABC transporter ATP-binding protein [Longimicrobium terrae]|uniref:Polar amino acid transport system ATP-binding protein/sulfate transport system ATP-binding protein n=1 Tax=Longimicrobium terrae TaxID=1639882 RepID=A0A841GYC1_9BACT|nr:ABC transporter ATP-binding protein [Longimicrobium terrae]MBB4636323.1 polar amino acid transport system ATP-binding protein/sulfate transport system ATP-binding protein [Longimicrobium terrae]MBB6070719.1 polar amino acid transport system ATP-binding protein/sulfate transport system ATP-binding protein [Longimicrobium terrae]NNC29699.1 ABC transporter ATP-binding protein [Longimicrobium terrae]
MSSEFQFERTGVLLELQNVSVTRGGVPVLRDLNATVRDVVRPGMSQGQVVGLLGPSGIGKTTLFHVLAGLLKPDSGSVKVGAEGKPASPGLVGVVAQNYVLFEHRSVLGNLVIAAKQAGMTGEQARAASLKYLERFGLAAHAEKYPMQLSGGQRQRVAIAQQLLCSELYLVMDEPFSGLDVIQQENVQRLIQEVSQTHEHNTLILVTHDVSAAVAVCDTIWLMGRERDAAGAVIPGARIMEEIDLLERDLAWHPDIRTRPGYIELVNEIKGKFAVL